MLEPNSHKALVSMIHRRTTPTLHSIAIVMLALVVGPMLPAPSCCCDRQAEKKAGSVETGTHGCCCCATQATPDSARPAAATDCRCDSCDDCENCLCSDPVVAETALVQDDHDGPRKQPVAVLLYWLPHINVQRLAAPLSIVSIDAFNVQTHNCRLALLGMWLK